MAKVKNKVFFATLEPISSQMAGPAIRCIELAQQLSGEFDVTVFSPRSTDLSPEWAKTRGFTLATGLGKHRLYQLASANDILFIQANVLKPYPGLAKLEKYLVVDLYDPYLLSLLAQYTNDTLSGSASYRLMHQILEKHMVLADFSVCASARQRDYWIGRYCALGRITPELYSLDPTLDKLIDIVPFGLPSQEPIRTGLGMKGQIPGIKPEDFVALWGGGIWEWFDPLTIIKAVAQVSVSDPQVKLFFMGWKSPNPQVPLMPMAVRCKQFAQEVGILNKHVFFGEDWIDYDKRVNYLLDADIAVSAHFDLLETRFSFRTRLLDYLWAQLPILTTSGDELAEMIAEAQAGLALPYSNVDAWAQAISRLKADQSLRENFRHGSKELSQQFLWQKVSEPLVQFCREPHHLPRFVKVTMPSLVERARAVYSRGGKQLVLKRTQDIVEEFLQK